MRILHLGKYYAPYRGGIETVLQNLCEAHAPLAEVVALVGNTSPSTIDERIGGVRVVRAARLATPLSVPIVPSLAVWLRRLRPDIIVHHEPNPGALLSYLAAAPPATFIIWFHSDIVRQRIFYDFYKPFLRAALRRARAIVVASPNHVRYTPILEEFADKCLVVPFGIDIKRFQLSPEIVARTAAIRATSNLPIILFVGRFAYYKGISYLIEATRNIRARLVLVGSGPLDAELQQQARRIPTQSVIDFVGEVSDQELVSLLHACDVFVLPSVERTEAFGVVQVEAMACGKPIVSCRIPSGVPWVNQDEVTGLTVRPEDPGALAEGINRLLGDEDLRRRLGENGRVRAHREFTLERMAGAFWEIVSLAREGRVADRYQYNPRDVVSAE